MNYLEGYVDGEDDPLLKPFKALYVTVVITRALTYLPLKDIYIEGTNEDRLSRAQRVTPAVIKEASQNGDDDDEIWRYINRIV